MLGTFTGDSSFSPSSTRCLSISALPEHLSRGIGLHNIFRSFGKVLRVTPNQLPHDEQAQLINLSEPASGLAFFISHCWGSSGFLKYLALLMYAFGAWATFGATLAAMCVLFVQRFAVELPALATRHEEDFQFSFGISPWEFCTGLLVGCSILLCGHRCCRRVQCFLDCACIHQTDYDLKMEGITHLPGFLVMSKKLVILWDELYFTRGWCTYELASYLALNPTGEIVLLPLGVNAAMIGINVYCAFGMCIALLMWPALPGMVGQHFSGFMALMPIYAFVAVSAEKLAKDKALLQQHLETFDIIEASVSSKDDKDKIITSVELLLGSVSRFNMMVRSHVKDIVLEQFAGQRAPVPYKAMLITTFPLILFAISTVSSMRHLAAPVQFAILPNAVTQIFACQPCLLAACIALCNRLAITAPQSIGRWPVRWQHLCVGMVFAAATQTQFYPMYVVPIEVASGTSPHFNMDPWHGPLIGAAFSLPWWLLTVYLFWPGQRRGTRRDRDRVVAIVPSKLQESIGCKSEGPKKSPNEVAIDNSIQESVNA